MFWIIITKIESVIADGAHDTNRNFFRYLEENEITLGIKVRKNSIVLPKNNRLRNKEVRLQATKDLLKWRRKKKRKYGRGDGWMAETNNLFIYQENVW